MVKGLTLYARDPATHTVSVLKGTSNSFPSFTCKANPAFVLSFASDGLLDPPDDIKSKLGLRNAMYDCFRPWQTGCPPLDFYKDSYVGEFGRSIPMKYRQLLPTTAPVRKMDVDSDDSELQKVVEDLDSVMADASMADNDDAEMWIWRR